MERFHRRGAISALLTAIWLLAGTGTARAEEAHAFKMLVNVTQDDEPGNRYIIKVKTANDDGELLGLQYIKGVPDPAARNGMRWTGVNYDLPAIRRGVNLVKEEDPIEVRVVDLKAMAGFSGAAGGRLEMEILREWGAFSIDRRILHLRMSRRNGGWVVEAEEPEITLFNRIYFVARRDEDNDPVGVERVVLKRGDVVARNINTSSLPALP